MLECFAGAVDHNRQRHGHHRSHARLQHQHHNEQQCPHHHRQRRYLLYRRQRQSAKRNVCNASITGLSIRSTGDVGGQGSVTVETGGTIYGFGYGIKGLNGGSGKLSITATGPVTGGGSKNSIGISAFNSAATSTDLSVTTGSSKVSGKQFGISGRNDGTGTTTITANGDVSGGINGIRVLDDAASSSITVMTGAASNIYGGQNAIYAIGYSSAAVTITTNGDVTSATRAAIHAKQNIASAPINITVNRGSAVTTNSPDDQAIFIEGGPADVTVGGRLNGGTGLSGSAIQFALVATNDRLELQPTATINGNVLAGGGTDTLAFGGTGTGTFDLSKIDAGALTQQYQGFENFQVESGTWSFSGATSAAFTVNGGTLKGTGTFGGLTVNGGTVAPGNSIGTMTVNGAFKLGSGAVYEVEVNAAGQSDKVIVNGTVNLTGSVLRVLAANGNYNTRTNYTIIDNDGTEAVAGSFASITSSLAFLTPTVVYNGGTGNDVVLTLGAQRDVVPGRRADPQPARRRQRAVAVPHRQRAVSRRVEPDGGGRANGVRRVVGRDPRDRRGRASGRQPLCARSDPGTPGAGQLHQQRRRAWLARGRRPAGRLAGAARHGARLPVSG